MSVNPPGSVLYYYGIYQSLYETMERELPFIIFHHGLPTKDELSQLSDADACYLVILDDLMESVTSSRDMEPLFVKGMYHRHLSVLYSNQNLNCKGKHSRTINLNMHILVLMKKPTDVSQLQCLARQAFLGKGQFLIQSIFGRTISWKEMMLAFRHIFERGRKPKRIRNDKVT